MLEKRHAVMVRLLVSILRRILPYLELLYMFERTCVNARIVKNSSINDITARQILYYFAKPVYVDRDCYVYIKKKKEMFSPFFPCIRKCYKWTQMR